MRNTDRPYYYILEGKTPVPVDFEEYNVWFAQNYLKRTVCKTELPDGVVVSTVFLGLDHAFGGGMPILFETMIFGGEHDEYCKRYCTWEEAEAGHQAAIEMIFEVY